MAGTIKISTVLLVVTLVLLVAVAWMLGSMTSRSEAATDTATTPATIQMSGTGKASVVPDEVAFTVRVSVKQSELDAALSAANAAMGRALKALGGHGVTRKDTQSTGLDMEPEYYYPDNGEPRLTGYRVSQSMRVVVRELSKAGGAISAVVKQAGNDVQVHNIALQVGDPEKAMGAARDKAIAQAREKAEQYAAASGAKLGSVLTVREAASSSPDSGVEVMNQAFDLAAAKSMPIRAGEDELSVRVSVTWKLTD